MIHSAKGGIEMRKWITLFLSLTLTVCFLPFLAYANSPGPNPEGIFEVNGTYRILLVLVYGIIIGFTCLAEWLAAIPFCLHQLYGKTIIVTNVVTQIIMHLLELMSIAVMPDGAVPLVWFSITVLVLEILVFVSEFFIYRRKIPGLSQPYLLAYTVCANCASLLGGLLLLMIFF